MTTDRTDAAAVAEAVTPESGIADPIPEATLARLARGDSNSLVRAAASGRITDFSLLDEIHQRDEEPSVREAASLAETTVLSA